MFEQLKLSVTSNPLVWVAIAAFLAVNNYNKIHPMLKSIFAKFLPDIEIPEASSPDPHVLVQQLITLTEDNPEAQKLARELGQALYSPPTK